MAAPPASIDVSLKETIACGFGTDTRIVEIEATTSEGNDKFKDGWWMVQLFKGKSTAHGDRIQANDNAVSFMDPTQVKKQYNNQNPYAFAIKGNILKFQLKTQQARTITILMWPASGYYEQKQVGDLTGSWDGGDNGPGNNTDKGKSLCAVRWDGSKIKDIIACDLKDRTKQVKTTTSGTTTYEYRAETLWDGDAVGGKEDFPQAEKIQYYKISAKKIDIDTVKAIQCSGDTTEPELGDDGRPTDLNVNIATSVQCTGTPYKRLLKATATVTSDKRNEFADQSWMVQWFRSDSGVADDRRYSNMLKDTAMFKGGEQIRANWTDRNPGAFLIQGNTCEIEVDSRDADIWTVWMWPGESNTTNNTGVDNEGGLDFGPDENNNLLQSLSGATFLNSDDNVSNVFAGGVQERRNQRTNGSKEENDREYEVNYEYLWSGKNNYSSEDLGNSKYSYWYKINSRSGNFDTSSITCAGETPKPDPEPTPEPEPEPTPTPSDPSLVIQCAFYTGEKIKTVWRKCKSSEKKEYQWQKQINDDWRDIRDETKDSYTPKYPGEYRCKGKCGDKRSTTDSCTIFEKPDTNPPSPTPDKGCTYEKLDWPGAPNFPLWTPTSRTYQMGDFPNRAQFCIRGNEALVLRGNQLVKTVLTLSYENVPDEISNDFLTHFNVFAGTSNSFQLAHLGNGNKGPGKGMDLFGFDDEGVTGDRTKKGTNKDMLFKGRWRYARPPQIQSIRPGISTCSITLLRKQGITKADDGVENHWRNYPNFPSFVPSNRRFTVGDWQTQWFAGTDGIEVGRVTSPQRNSFLELEYSNVPDIDASAFFRHYVAQWGTRGTFTLRRSTQKRGVWAGYDQEGVDGCKKWYEDGDWCYARPPKLTSVRKGISNMQVQLRCPFVPIQFIDND